MWPAAYTGAGINKANARTVGNNLCHMLSIRNRHKGAAILAEVRKLVKSPQGYILDVLTRSKV